MYSDLTTALNRARERSTAKPSDDGLLTEFLLMSAGTRLDNGAIEYRPFWAAAKFMRQSPKFQQIAAAEDGVKFTGMATPIADALETQRSLDLALSVPLGFEATDGGGGAGATASKASYEAALVSLKRWQPR
jgi:hypothetical protein